MKKLYILVLTFFILFTSLTSISQPLNGIKTIDPGGQGPNDYTSFGAAISALTNNGVNGPVVFEVVSNNFNEQISIPAITGVSSTNTITFVSQSGNKANVILSYSASSSSANYTVKLNGATYIIFKKMTIKADGSNYAKVFEFSGGASNITIDSCTVQTSNSSTSTNAMCIYSDGSANSNNVFSYNEFIGGETSIHWYGASGNNKANTLISNNSFIEFYNTGIDCKYNDNTVVTCNFMQARSSSSTGPHCIKFDNVNGASQITKNHLILNTAGYNYGIYLYNCSASSGSYGLIANNFISCNTSGTGSQYGIYLHTATYYNVVFNSINMIGGGSGSAAIFQHYGGNQNYQNNIMNQLGIGYAFYAYTTSAILQADYNCLFTNGTNIANWGGSKTDLAALQTASSKFTNSISYEAPFESQDNLHLNTIVLNGMGISLSSIVSQDFDGEARNATTPDIGADEFTLIPIDIGVASVDFPVNTIVPGNHNIIVSLTNFDTITLTDAIIKYSINGGSVQSYTWTGNITQYSTENNINIGSYNFINGNIDIKAWSEYPNNTYDNTNNNDTAFGMAYACNPLSGSYIIGGSSPDFATFTDAVYELSNCGISGPVTFLIAPGNYNEQVTLSTINGSSNTNNIRFISANGDNTSVILEYTAFNSSDNWVIKLDSVQYIGFSKMTINANNNSYSNVIMADNGSGFICIDSNIINTSIGSGFGIKLNDVFGDNMVISNSFTGGANSIYVSGINNCKLLIKNNGITDFTGSGIQAHYLDSLVVKQNVVISANTASTVFGIDVDNIIGTTKIHNNKIDLADYSSSGRGLRVSNCTASSGNRGIIANNFIATHSTKLTNGIVCYSNNYFDFYFNSISMRSLDSASIAFTQNYGSSINVVDNIINSIDSGYAFFAYKPTAFNNISYNCLNTGGSKFSYWHGIQTNLTSLQSSSSKFSNSISELPNFRSIDDLHLNAALSAKGTPISGITFDIDEDLRDAASPDMGADEFTMVPNDGGIVSIESSLPCEGKQTISVYLRNFGLDSILTAQIKWENYGNPKPVYNWIGGLAPDDSVLVILDTTFYTLSTTTYFLKAYTLSVNGHNEVNHVNDTAVSGILNYIQNPVVNIASLDPNYCKDTTGIALSASPSGGTFLGVGVSTNTFNPSVTPIGQATIYYQYTDMVGCTTIDSIQTQIRPLPTITVTNPLPPSFCLYDIPAPINVFPTGGSYVGTGMNNNIFEPNTAGAGNHEIIYYYTDTYGCSNSDTMSTAVYAKPNVSMTNPSSVCSNLQTVPLSNGMPSGGNYDGFAVNTGLGVFYPQIAGVGNHVINYVFTDSHNCSDTAHATIRVKSTPTSNFSLAASSCINDTVIINYTGQSGANALFTFNFDNGNTINGSGAGPYNVKWNNPGMKNISLSVSDSGCTSLTSHNYINIISTTAMITSSGLTNLCYGDSVTLFANTGSGFQYQWFDANGILISDTLAQLIVSSSGSYSCKVIPPSGCPAVSNSISVNVSPQLIADFSILNQACQGDTISITFNGSAQSTSSYNWNFDGAAVISGSGAGPYAIAWITDSIHKPSLMISDAGCFSYLKEKNINIIAAQASITALGNTSFCDGGSVSLLANSGPLQYQWYKNSQAISGSNQAYLTASQSGAYKVRVHDTLSGCYSTSMAMVVTSNTTDFNLAFTANPTSFTSAPFTTTIINQTPSMNNYYWNWNLGDGTNSSLISPSHTYNFNGQYTVGAIATDINTGCSDTLIKPNYINCNGGSPNPCTINPSISPAGYVTLCIGDSITLTATSGVGYTYQWVYNNTLIPNSDSLVFVATQAGNYQVIISDSSCSQTSPVFMLNNYPSIQPVVFAIGSLQPCTNDSVLLSVNVSYSTYSWNTGSSNSSIYVSQTGYYQVDVTDNYGCSLSSAPYALSNSFLNTPEICIVGVDSFNHNQIIWERQTGSLIDSFYIYREGNISNQYDKIGVLPFSTTSLFVDTNSNPSVRAYRYRIAAVDTCGGLTLMSNYHKTIHLTINAGLNGAWNLIWDGYHGFNYSSYRIYRGTNSNNMNLIAQLPSTASSFTDLYPPPGTLYYQIEVISPHDCYPDSVYTKGTTNYHTSRSNHANNSGITPQYLSADFSANINTGQWPIQIRFTDISSGNPDTWLWNFGDGNTSIEQNPKHTYNNTGLYTISLKVCNGGVCDTTIKSNFIQVLPNGIVEVNAHIEATFYPNPNNGQFTIHISSPKEKHIHLQIYSTLGELIYTEDLNVLGDINKQINLSGMAKGIYYLRLQSKDQLILMKKVIIQ